MSFYVRAIYGLLIFSTVCFGCYSQKSDFDEKSKFPDHAEWSELLGKHVDSAGHVSYSGFVSDSVLLNHYLNQLSSNAPNETWQSEEKLAYWINAYNAFTIKLIVDHYPVSSIKDIKKGIPFVNSVWDLKFFSIGGEGMDLNFIEHQILRKEFDEPRIHFAIVCASISCPKLRNEAFVAGKLEQQLQDQAIDFINDPRKNKLSADVLQISSIFKWFEADFAKKGDIRAFISKYFKQTINPKAKVKYLDYDWNLNGK
jgi:hypothetical protein